MKKLFPLFISILLFNSAFSQIAYYGAIKINNDLIIKSGDAFKFNPDSVHILSAYLKAYLSDKYMNDKALTDGQVLDKFRNNPFFGKQIITLLNSGAGADNSDLLKKTISSIGNLDITSFADGLAKFLVKRVKQELSISFFERFRDDLNSNDQLQIIFPATFSALKAIDKEIYNYSVYLDLLRESFQKDFMLLLPHIDELVNDDSMNEIFSKYPEVRIMLSHAYYIVKEFGEGKFPGEIFHNYFVEKARKDSIELEKVNKYIYPSLATLDLFSQSLRSQQADQYWIGSDSLKLLFDNLSTFQIYLGLIYQQATNASIHFTDKITLASTLAENKDSLIQLYKPYLIGLLERGKSIDYYYYAIKEKQKTGKDKPAYQDYYSLYDASINFLEYLTRYPDLNKLVSKDDLQDYFSSARSMGNIYIDINEKQYTSAIVEFTGIFQTLLSTKINHQIEINKAGITKADKEKKLTLEQANAKLEKIINANALILKYGSLAASIAKAENSEDVKNAIEAAALPAGSSRIKRETPFNVSLNAYTGLFLGYEKITGVKDKHMINSYGLAAPVGVATSWGVHHWSLSGFISIIDLGAVAAFRFQNDTVDQVPTIKLQDIFSPGLFFSIGIPKCPLSVNMGAQVGPNLRKVYSRDENTGEYVNLYQDNVYWRFSISLVVDLPIVNFYTKSR